MEPSMPSKCEYTCLSNGLLGKCKDSRKQLRNNIRNFKQVYKNSKFCKSDIKFFKKSTPKKFRRLGNQYDIMRVSRKKKVIFDKDSIRMRNLQKLKLISEEAYKAHLQKKKLESSKSVSIASSQKTEKSKRLTPIDHSLDDFPDHLNFNKKEKYSHQSQTSRKNILNDSTLSLRETTFLETDSNNKEFKIQNLRSCGNASSSILTRFNNSNSHCSSSLKTLEFFPASSKFKIKESGKVTYNEELPTNRFNPDSDVSSNDLLSSELPDISLKNKISEQNILDSQFNIVAFVSANKTVQDEEIEWMDSEILTNLFEIDVDDVEKINQKSEKWSSRTCDNKYILDNEKLLNSHHSNILEKQTNSKSENNFNKIYTDEGKDSQDDIKRQIDDNSQCLKSILCNCDLCSNISCKDILCFKRWRKDSMYVASEFDQLDDFIDEEPVGKEPTQSYIVNIVKTCHEIMKSHSKETPILRTFKVIKKERKKKKTIRRKNKLKKLAENHKTCNIQPFLTSYKRRWQRLFKGDCFQFKNKLLFNPLILDSDSTKKKSIRDKKQKIFNIRNQNPFQTVKPEKSIPFIDHLNHFLDPKPRFLLQKKRKNSLLNIDDSDEEENHFSIKIKQCFSFLNDGICLESKKCLNFHTQSKNTKYQSLLHCFVNSLNEQFRISSKNRLETTLNQFYVLLPTLSVFKSILYRKPEQSIFEFLKI